MRHLSPFLEAFRPAIRPPLRAIYRLVRGRSSPPLPAEGGPVAGDYTDFLRELYLEPTWNPLAGGYELHCDDAELSRRLAETRIPAGSVGPYVVRPVIATSPNFTTPKVLHVIPNVFVGGSTQLIIDLVHNLGGRFRHEVLTSALWHAGHHEGLTTHLVSAPDRAAMVEVLSKSQPDLIHMHYWGLVDDPWYHAVLDALGATSAPAIQNVNTPIAPLRSPRFAHYVFVSEYLLNEFGRDASEKATSSVIYPGIDLPLFRAGEPGAEAEQAIGMVYRLENDKLTENSIDLFVEVVRRRPRTKVYIIGGGSLLHSYMERTVAAGVRNHFRFTGYVPYESLPAWYDRFGLFVAPVWQESFGQVVPFAMSKGLAVAGYKIGALPEILGSSETLGTGVHETANIIVDLLEDPGRLRSIGNRNRTRANGLFDVKLMASRYRNLYARLLVTAA
jgi:glycosyltransferase involved in cell wall biosynthesis